MKNLQGFWISNTGDLIDVDTWTSAHADTYIKYIEEHDPSLLQKSIEEIQQDHIQNPYDADEHTISRCAKRNGWIRIITFNDKSGYKLIEIDAISPSPTALQTLQGFLNEKQFDRFRVNGQEQPNLYYTMRATTAHNWYMLAKFAQQAVLPFMETLEHQDKPIPLEVINAPKIPELLDDVILDCKNLEEVQQALNMNGFQWEIHQLLKETVITVNINGTTYIIDDFYLPTSKMGGSWLNEMWDHELQNYIAEPEDDFWDNVTRGSSVYHATTEENLPLIMQEGLQPKNSTRAISNRGTGAAIFTSEDPSDIESYGNVILKINLGQMKEDGYTPEVSQEIPIEEIKTKSQLANTLNIDYQPSTDYTSEGLYDNTIIFYNTIPPKYLSVQ